MAQSWIMLCTSLMSGTITSDASEPSGLIVVTRAPGSPLLGYVTPIFSLVAGSVFRWAVSAPPANGCRARSWFGLGLGLGSGLGLGLRVRARA